MNLSIIIPVYNEANTVEKVLQAVRKTKIPKVRKEIIVVDDGSTDGTRAILNRNKNCINKLILLKHRLGKGAAIKRGLARVKGDFVLIQDADWEYDPADYHILLEPILKKRTQVVFGSRYLKSNPKNHLYSIGNRVVTWLFNLRFKTQITDISTCYKVFPKILIPTLTKIPHNDFVFDVFQITRVTVEKGLYIQEVPITYRVRKFTQGKKLNPFHGIKILWEVIRSL